MVRLEQIYPLAYTQIQKLKDRYPNAKEWKWVQEEPRNMGAWPFIMRKFLEEKEKGDRGIHIDFGVISRKESSSPATGYKKQHKSQQDYIINSAFGIIPPVKKPAEKAAVNKN